MDDASCGFILKQASMISIKTAKTFISKDIPLTDQAGEKSAGEGIVATKINLFVEGYLS